MFEKIVGYINKYKIVAIIIIGCVLRLAFIGRIPGNYNYFQDEAFSAYEAYSMLNYGMDSHGYHNPVYLETWGSGMSAVQCYCQMFWIKLLGFGPIAVRLPQAILGCVTLAFFYFLIKELTDVRVAFWSTFILAICPWHIIMSRWGLDCNYFVGLVTIALFFLVTSKNNIWKTIFAAFFMAITIYSYASPWIVMPVIVLGTIIVLYSNGEMSIKSIVIYVITLGILVFPLFLFIAINLGVISEIRTSIISIPQLSYFRSDDAKISFENFKQLVTYFWTQYDYISYDSALPYGTYFLYSNIFLLIGLARALFYKNKKSIIMWIWLLCGIVLGLLVQPNFERINILFMPLIFFIGMGIVCIIDFFGKTKTIGTFAFAVLYGVSAVSFAKYYFTDYNAMMERVWSEGTQEVIEFAQQYNGTIHISDIRHPFVLCFSKYPVEKYIETVVYEDDHAKFLQPVTFEGYDFTEYIHNDAIKGDVYICSVENDEAVEWLAEHDMSCAQFGKFYLGVAN